MIILFACWTYYLPCNIHSPLVPLSQSIHPDFVPQYLQQLRIACCYCLSCQSSDPLALLYLIPHVQIMLLLQMSYSFSVWDSFSWSGPTIHSWSNHCLYYRLLPSLASWTIVWLIMLCCGVIMFLVLDPGLVPRFPLHETLLESSILLIVILHCSLVIDPPEVVFSLVMRGRCVHTFGVFMWNTFCCSPEMRELKIECSRTFIPKTQAIVALREVIHSRDNRINIL